MGRPINKRYFGALADGTNITINCQVAGNSESAVGIILSQRSVNKFNVDDSKTGGGNIGICTLVDKADGALGANEMSINAQDAQGGTIRIAKLHNRTVKDFSNNRYTWVIENDSTTSIMRVTAI
jgi:hypothetical protein|tara:strand:- start:411 stop:782 length:372 start_codon:yes stop_codon:yes gene_type:complete